MSLNVVKNAESQSMQQEDCLDYFCDINLISSICRICLERNQQNKTMINLFDIKESQIPMMIMSCSEVQLSIGDGLPNMICNNCFAKLNMAWQFKIQSENSDAKLRHCYYSNRVHHISVDFEDSLDSLLKRDQVFLSTQDFKPAASATNCDKIELKIDINENVSAMKNIKHEKGVKKWLKIHQCNTCGKTFNRREYVTQHIRIHTGEKPYHCHLCDKRFVNSGHLTTHMRTHTGEKPHNCISCPKAFSTRQELQKHVMVHNGTRPYVCSTCKKCFGSSSNLYSHLKHHTGEKNFTCEHCGKAFYTKQELEQHLVVHTGEKPHLCEYCNKRFSQIAHLRRHYKLHKR